MGFLELEQDWDGAGLERQDGLFAWRWAGLRRESRSEMGLLGGAGQVVGCFSHCLGGRGLRSPH